MAELSLPTRFRARGPWLLDSAQLQRLEAEVEAFVQEEPVRAAGAANSGAAADRPGALARSLTILLSRDRELQIESFKQAFVHAGFQDEVPVGFVYKLRLGVTQALVRISADADKGRDRPGSPLPGSFAITPESKGEGEELEIEVEPRAARLSQELFAVLKGWAEDVQPSFWQRGLLMLRPWARLILVLMLILGGVSFFSPTTDYKQLYKEEAHKILKEGVNQSNQQRAIALMLALQTDYSPPVQKQPRFGTVNVTFVIFAVLFAAVAITPRICLGFWRGKRRLHLWKEWMRVITVTVPTVILAHYFWPGLFNFIEKGFRH